MPRRFFIAWLSAAILVPAARAACTPDGHRLCLLEDRFAVEMEWQRAPGDRRPGGAVQLTGDRAGAFAGARPDNLELFVKMVDGGPANGHFWVLFGSLSTLDMSLRVEDTESGAVRSYRHEAGPMPRSGFDTAAFPSPDTGAPSPPATLPGTRHGEDSAASCQAGTTALCLLDGRFRVEASWIDPRDGTLRAARAGDSVGRSGLLWFFGPSNPELAVKVVDGRSLNGSFWVFAGALTSLEYELRVTDLGSGRVRIYSPPRAVGVADTGAFSESLHPPHAPVITEPDVDGRVLSVADVHMETAPFMDPDAADEHYCSDFEIWQATAEPPRVTERVWRAACVTGLMKAHVHLGDGSWEGGRAELRFLEVGSPHELRVRHRDTSGVWGPFAVRTFSTGLVARPLPLRLTAVGADPPPRWSTADGTEVVLPGTTDPPSLRLESAAGDLLLELRGEPDGSTSWHLGAPLAAPLAVRVRLDGGGVPSLRLAPSQLQLADEAGTVRELFLPELVAGDRDLVRISTNGSSFAPGADPAELPLDDLLRHTPHPFLARDGYAVEVVATGLRMPVNVAFGPPSDARGEGPLLYVSELYGDIKTVSRDGAVGDFATDLLNFDPNGLFPGSGEIGLTGITVDALTGDVLASLVYALEPGDPAAGVSGRVLRLPGLDAGWRSGDPAVLLDLAPAQLNASHQISSLSFGPDGMLYVHVGDGFQAERAQDLHSFLGKILRLDRGGLPPPDNPFYDQSDGTDAADYVFARGFRNPFGGAWRDLDGALYEVENGPAVDRLARVDAAANYGWDRFSSGPEANAAMTTRAIYNWGPPAHSPVNLAFVQASAFGGSAFPEAQRGNLFVAEFAQTLLPGPTFTGKRISELVLDADGSLAAGPDPLVEYVGYGPATVVALAAGPDGLYFSDFFNEAPAPGAPLGTNPIGRGARLWRVRWIGGAPSR